MNRFCLYLIKIEIMDDFVQFWQKMEKNPSLLIDTRKIRILIGHSFIKGKFMINLHKRFLSFVPQWHPNKYILSLCTPKNLSLIYFSEMSVKKVLKNAEKIFLKRVNCAGEGKLFVTSINFLNNLWKYQRHFGQSEVKKELEFSYMSLKYAHFKHQLFLAITKNSALQLKLK